MPATSPIIAPASLPGFSIVVPTFGRPDLVARLLLSLHHAQAKFDGASEIILIDSTGGEAAEKIKGLSEQYQARYLRAENHVGRKRNAGIEAALFDTILFIDSDCRAEPDLLLVHRHTHQAAADRRVAGVLGLTEWEGEAGRVWQLFAVASSMTAAFRLATWLREAPWGTCTNLSIRRDALLAIGGFDETFPTRVYGEDVDLGLRLGQAGYRIVTNPLAVVGHDRAGLNTFPAALRKSVRTGRADFHLGRRHPNRLALEFPSATSLSLIWFALGLLILAVTGLPAIALSALLFLPLYLLLAATLTSLSRRPAAAPFTALLGAGLLEVAFEIGRMTEALRHGGFQRLWTKFTYIDAQLLAERDRRVIQAWCLIAALLITLLCLEIWS